MKEKVYQIFKKREILKSKKRIILFSVRDTANLSVDKIIMSIVETIMKILLMALYLRVFFALWEAFGLDIFGKTVSLALPFAMTYKAINTLDSMVGYKNEKYIDFGKFLQKS